MLQLVDDGASFNLLVTNYLMPGMNGVDLARAFWTSLPNLPVLIVFGEVEVEGVAPDFPLLTKPFRSAELAACLASVFDARFADASLKSE